MERAGTNAPFPFRKIAVAIAFSPRIEAILAESKRLQNIFDAKLIFVHVGDKNLQQEQYLRDLLNRFDLNRGGNEIVWEQGDPVERILAKCKEHDVDLLVAGAMEKENLLRYFLGSVARRLSRRAKCSILMLREPSIRHKPVSKIVVEGSDHPKTPVTVQSAIYTAKCAGAAEVHIIQESDVSLMALVRSEDLTDDEAEEQRERIIREEQQMLQEVLKKTGTDSLKVVTERIEGKPGYVICKYAREIKADLLLLNSPDTRLNLIDRVFPHDIEYALADLPCDLMIIHQKGHPGEEDDVYATRD
jgi:nucleotide-binding universal stress UspA family protein